MSARREEPKEENSPDVAPKAPRPYTANASKVATKNAAKWQASGSEEEAARTRKKRRGVRVKSRRALMVRKIEVNVAA